VTLLFALAAPKAVFAVFAGVRAAGLKHRALQADLTGARFAALTSLGALGERGKEDVREPTASASGHPVVVGLEAVLEVEQAHAWRA
jgi:hypothetical protein